MFARVAFAVRRVLPTSSRPCSTLVYIGALLCGSSLGCDLRRGAVRDWTPADHDRPAPSRPVDTRQAEEGPPPGSSPPSTGTADLTEVAWNQHCLGCHGPRGQGDGPQGPMMRAPDLTRSEWQSRVSDAEIEATIRSGRGAMPAFATLPASVVQGLVRRIRSSVHP